MRSILILLCAAVCHAKDDQRVLRAIANVESGCDYSAVGDRGRSLGAYQMQSASWSEANQWLASNGMRQRSRSSWRDPQTQHVMADAFLQVIRRRFLSIGIQHPTPAQIAVVWNRGWGAASRSGFRPNDYALRVQNLCP